MKLMYGLGLCVKFGNEENIKIGNSIESFIEFCKEQNNCIGYFHNLKFDGSFIISWLFNNGFCHVDKKEDIKENTFTTLISDMGQFYSITIYFSKNNKHVHKITFIDSLKIIPFSVKKIAETFNLPISKLEIDYNLPREKGHILTHEEESYIKNDVLIVAKALQIMFEENLTKMTIASNALNNFKQMIGKSKFNHLFPKLSFEVDRDIRQSYKGGFTYLNKIYKNKNVSQGVVLDVNSLYPFCMKDKLLPFGEPLFFEGQYKEDKVYNLYVQMISCSFEIKENKIPTIQIKGKRFEFIPTEYLESSNNKVVDLILTNIDLQLFLEHYNIYDLKYKCGWKFKSIKGIFTKYIDKWIEEKNQGTLENNGGKRQRAKLMLNSLYGKFRYFFNCAK